VAVVRSTIELGRSLNRLVVAEGVERDDQRLALWEMGCPAAQGHLFGKPMSIEALLAVVADGAGGVQGRLRHPIHAPARNVIELPRARRPDAASGEA
jgi:predicted signal transduction protein with EAL and GGDEF domain